MSEPIILDGGAEVNALQSRAYGELTGKGYRPGIVTKAIQRARGMADFHTRDLSVDLRDRAFVQIFRAELGRAENWIRANNALLEE